jgi:hypothetical protein
MVNTGFDGYLLGLSSTGISCPSHSTLNTFIEVFFAGFLRLVGLGYLHYWNSVCSKHHRRRQEEEREGEGWLGRDPTLRRGEGGPTLMEEPRGA